MNLSAPGAVSRFEGLVGASAVISDPAQLSPYAISGAAPSVALQPTSAEEILEIVKFANSEGLAIILSGARTKLTMGLPPRRYDVALDLSRFDRIDSCDPEDLTLSVEPGITLRTLAQSLGKHRQFLPLGAPFASQATIGGTIASGVEGPLRQLYGTSRDFILGMEFVTGDGVPGKSGGRVVKNVTGYDLHKPMIGSLGTLAVLTKINFRTFPAPQSLRGFAVHFPSADRAAICRDRVAASALRPLTFEILSSHAARLLTGEAAARIEPSALPAEIFSSAAWTVATSFAGNNEVLARCEHDLRAMAEAAGATHITAIGDEKTGAQLASVFGRVREFVPIALASSPAATVMKLSVLPEHIEHALAAVKYASEDHSLPCAALARGMGIIYVALLPVVRDEHSMNCVLAATNRIHGDIARLGGHATIPWCPAEWKRALSVWGPERADLLLMQKLKAVFDPRDVLAPGRFVGGI